MSNSSSSGRHSALCANHRWYVPISMASTSIPDEAPTIASGASHSLPMRPSNLAPPSISVPIPLRGNALEIQAVGGCGGWGWPRCAGANPWPTGTRRSTGSEQNI